VKTLVAPLTLGFCLGVCLPSTSLLAADPSAKEFSADKVPEAAQLIKMLKPGHPRLLIDEAALADLKRRITTDAVLREWDKAVHKEADKLLSASLPKHVLPDGKRLLSTSRTVLHRSYTLSLMYRLHGDARHRDRLWRELETVAAFPDFNPKHFLDTAEMTHALAIAYDWLYDSWTDDRRATIRKAIVELGLKPGREVYRRKGGWPRCTHNWNQVCNGGLTMGALAVGDEEPALAGEILRSALESIPLAMQSYAPDGAWGEGPGYWAYATTYNVAMLAGLQSALGTDFGLSRAAGFDRTGLFPISMAGPTDRWFNFEDSGDRVGRSDCLLWLGKRFNLPACTWFAVNGGKPSAPGMILYDGPGKDPVAAGLPRDQYWRGVEVATLRSHWTDLKAVFVGIQAGSNQVNHNHLDLGSFVLDALGQRWAVDLGGDDYNLPGYFGGKRYDYYRLRAEGHNTLVLNPGADPDQDPRGVARISRFVSQEDLALTVADLTAGYAKHARRVQRGVALLDRHDVLVQDEVDADKLADLWWFLHTPATVKVEASGRSAVLEQGGQKLIARILAPESARFEVRPAEPLPSSPNPAGQRRNDSTRKLAIHLAKIGSVRLAVLLVPADGKSDPSRAIPLKPLAEWGAPQRAGSPPNLQGAASVSAGLRGGYN